MNEQTTQTIGDRIAEEFSRDKRHLSDAEKRRLAGMIDSEMNKAHTMTDATEILGEAELAEIKARADEIEGLPYQYSVANREVRLFIAHARKDIPRLLSTLSDMEQRKDAAYLERNQVVAALAAMAIAIGCKAGIAKTAIEGWSEDWHQCVYINLPTGQVSWHYHDSQAHLFAFLPEYHNNWDGHDTPEKYRRLQRLTTTLSARAARISELERRHDALRLEIVAALTSVGIAMLVGSDPCAPGEVNSAVRRLAGERDKLQAFKDYAHQRLTVGGVPEVIEDQHHSEGCRIGGRLDWVFARISALEADCAAMKRLNEKLAGNCVNEMVARLSISDLELVEERDRLKEALRWRRLGDEKPEPGITVLLSQSRVHGPGHTEEAKYADGKWDHDNWHGPMDANDDDQWLPMPRPDSSPQPPAKK